MMDACRFSITKIQVLIVYLFEGGFMKKFLIAMLAATSVAAFADEMQAAPAANSMPAPAGMSSTNGGLGANNLYVGVAAGAAWNNVQAPDTAFRADAGYNFDPFWALEVGTTGLTQAGGMGNQSMEFYDVSIKGTLPMGDLFSLFAQVGGAYGSPGSIGALSATGLSQLQAGWDVLTAVGMQMNVTQQVSLNLTDYYYYGANGPQGDTNVLLAGLKYNF